MAATKAKRKASFALYIQLNWLIQLLTIHCQRFKYKIMVAIGVKKMCGEGRGHADMR